MKLKCEVCDVEIGIGDDYRTLTVATCSEIEQPHPKTRVVRQLHEIKRWVQIRICAQPTCLEQAVVRLR